MACGSELPMHEIRTGDKVRTKHETSMNWGDYEISMVFPCMSDRILLDMGYKSLICPLDQKIYSQGVWLRTEYIRAGANIEGVRVLGVSSLPYGEISRIFVKDAQTYICNGVLMHS